MRGIQGGKVNGGEENRLELAVESFFKAQFYQKQMPTNEYSSPNHGSIKYSYSDASSSHSGFLKNILQKIGAGLHERRQGLLRRHEDVINIHCHFLRSSSYVRLVSVKARKCGFLLPCSLFLYSWRRSAGTHPTACQSGRSIWMFWGIIIRIADHKTSKTARVPMPRSTKHTNLLQLEWKGTGWTTRHDMIPMFQFPAPSGQHEHYHDQGRCSMEFKLARTMATGELCSSEWHCIRPNVSHIYVTDSMPSITIVGLESQWFYCLRWISCMKMQDGSCWSWNIQVKFKAYARPAI